MPTLSTPTDQEQPVTALDTRTRLDPFQQGDTFDPATVVWINRLRDLRHLLAAIETAEEVVIDLETTGLDEHAVLGGPANGGYPARIVLASLTLPQRDDPLDPRPPTFLVPLSHPESPLQGYWRAVTRRIAEALREWGGPITNQNLKFDLRWIAAHTGIDLSPQLAWDTQVSSHLLDETVPTSLKKRAPATFGIPPWDDFDLSYPGAAEQVPVIDLGLYAARDTYWTWRLAVLHRTILGVGKEGEDQDPPDSPDEVEARRLGSLAVWCAMPTVATLASVETRGMGLDVEWIETRAAELRSTADSTRRRLARRYRKEMAAKGHDPDRTSFAPTSLWFRAWAECAVEAGDLKVAALTPTGIPQWSKAVLIRQQRAGSEVAGLLLEHRQAVKSLEFLTAWLQVVTPDHRVHATYHVGRVVTGRLSASDPNVQQITKSLKPAFIPRPGYLIAELDYCLEGSMRILTSDLHWVAADQIEVGQKIIGFPETVGVGAGHRHTYEETEVTSVRTLRRPSVIVLLSDGRQVRCSREHRWMTYPVGGRGPRAWTEAGDLVPGQIIPTLTDPWDDPEPVDAAYLRGFLDGEGWVSETTVGWGQLPGTVRDEVIACSQRLGIELRQSNHLNNGVEQHISTTMSESLRILGMIRPHRLLPKARQVWEGRRTYGKYQTGVQVLGVIDAGEQSVVAVGTGTRTMVVEGLLSHNSQIELRAAAFVADCAPMKQAFVNGDDLHRLIAATITGKAPQDVTPVERQGGKAANFGFLYGQGADGFREYAETNYGVSFTPDEAHRVRDAFFERWDGMGQWHARQVARAHTTGQVVSPLGRVRRLPDIHDGNPSVSGHAERSALNAPVQGFASDIMQIAAASIEGRLPGHAPVPGVAIIATVHDSIVVEVPEDDWQIATGRCMRRMLDVAPVLARMGCHLDVPLAVEASVSTRWGLGDVGVIT